MKCCFLQNCLSVPYLSLRFLQYFLKARLLRLQRQWFVISLVARVHPLNHQEKIPPGANGQLDLEEGFIPSASRGEGLGCTMELGDQGEGSTALQIGKNPGSNSDLPQEADRETNHLPEIP
jgi:hypothetical protein